MGETVPPGGEVSPESSFQAPVGGSATPCGTSVGLGPCRGISGVRPSELKAELEQELATQDPHPRVVESRPSGQKSV
jgi:hypothetical protein